MSARHSCQWIVKPDRGSALREQHLARETAQSVAQLATIVLVKGSMAEERVARTSYTEASSSSAFREVMAGAYRPTAVFCINDYVAVGALNAARDLRLSVPGDVTIVGFDDLPIASWLVIDLTTVANPLPDTRRAAQLLVERMASGPSAPYRHEVARTGLVLRSSHAPPPRGSDLAGTRPPRGRRT